VFRSGIAEMAMISLKKNVSMEKCTEKKTASFEAVL